MSRFHTQPLQPLPITTGKQCFLARCSESDPLIRLSLLAEELRESLDNPTNLLEPPPTPEPSLSDGKLAPPKHRGKHRGKRQGRRTGRAKKAQKLPEAFLVPDIFECVIKAVVALLATCSTQVKINVLGKFYLEERMFAERSKKEMKYTEHLRHMPMAHLETLLWPYVDSLQNWIIIQRRPQEKPGLKYKDKTPQQRRARMDENAAERLQIYQTGTEAVSKKKYEAVRSRLRTLHRLHYPTCPKVQTAPCPDGVSILDRAHGSKCELPPPVGWDGQSLAPPPSESGHSLDASKQVRTPSLGLGLPLVMPSSVGPKPQDPSPQVQSGRGRGVQSDCYCQTILDKVISRLAMIVCPCRTAVKLGRMVSALHSGNLPSSVDSASLEPRPSAAMDAIATIAKELAQYHAARLAAERGQPPEKRAKSNEYLRITTTLGMLAVNLVAVGKVLSTTIELMVMYYSSNWSSWTRQNLIACILRHIWCEQLF